MIFTNTWECLAIYFPGGFSFFSLTDLLLSGCDHPGSETNRTFRMELGNDLGWTPHLKMLHDCTSGTGCSGTTPHLLGNLQQTCYLNAPWIWEPRLNNSPLFYPLNIMCPASSFNSKFETFLSSNVSNWFNGWLFSGTALARLRKVSTVCIQCADILNYFTMMTSPTLHDEAQRKIDVVNDAD